tara:strand:+ start:5 stop:586 length:582 start_codon:yes stop_codon:yes gene_type:complete
VKKFLGIVVLGLFLITPSWADNISDFQIEGMSIGDSLLDYFTEAQIKSLSKTEYKSKKYSRIVLRSNSLEVYDDVDFYFKTNDKKFTMKAVVGGLYYQKDFNECFNKKDEIVNEIKALFDNIEMETEKMIHPADTSGKSTEYKVEFIFNSGSVVKVSCMDWSDEITKQHYWEDHLKVGVYDIEFIEWLINEAY